MNVEAHLRNLRESLELIEESIGVGLVERQRTIGFNTSAASADMLEIMLHRRDLIDPGFIVKHEWMKSRRKTQERFQFDFPKKEEILSLMTRIEEKRNTLCYGKPQKDETIRGVIENFNTLKKIFREVGVDEI